MTQPRYDSSPATGSGLRRASTDELDIAMELLSLQRRRQRHNRRRHSILRHLRVPAAAVVSAVAAASAISWYPHASDHGVASACHHGDPLAGVDWPQRLTMVEPCGFVTGTVECVRRSNRDDGDITFNLQLDPPYRRDLTADNATITCSGKPGPDLHVEIIPNSCGTGQDQLTANNCASRGGFTTPDPPRVGDRVAVIGPVVHDSFHANRGQLGWTEIHPAERVIVIRRPPMAPPQVVAPDPEQTAPSGQNLLPSGPTGTAGSTRTTASPPTGATGPIQSPPQFRGGLGR